MAVPRTLKPSTNPTGWITAAAAAYAAITMIWNAATGRGVIDPSIIVAAVTAAAAVLTRQAVTPITDPRDGNGHPLIPAPPPPPPVACLAPAEPPWATELRAKLGDIIAAEITPIDLTEPPTPRKPPPT